MKRRAPAKRGKGVAAGAAATTGKKAKTTKATPEIAPTTPTNAAAADAVDTTTAGAGSHVQQQSNTSSDQPNPPFQLGKARDPSQLKALSQAQTIPHPPPPNVPVDLEILRLKCANQPSIHRIHPKAACIHPCSVESMTATQDLQWVFTGGSDGIVRRWDVFDSFLGKAALTVAQRQVYQDSIHNGGVLLSHFEANQSETPVVNPLPVTVKGKKKADVPPKINDYERDGPVTSLKCQQEGVWVISGGKDGSIKLYSVRVAHGHLQHTFSAHEEYISGIDLMDSEKTMVAASWDRKLSVWDLDTGAQKLTLSGHCGQITGLTCREKEPLVLTSSIDGSVRLWDVRVPDPCVRVLYHNTTPQPWVMSVCWAADGLSCFSGRRDACIDQWDLRAGTHSDQILGPTLPESVTALAAPSNGNQLIAASKDNIRVWNIGGAAGVETRRAFLTLAGHSNGMVSELIMDEDMKYLLSSSGARGWGVESDKSCLLYDIRTKIPQQTSQ